MNINLSLKTQTFIHLWMQMALKCFLTYYHWQVQVDWVWFTLSDDVNVSLKNGLSLLILICTCPLWLYDFNLYMPCDWLTHSSGYRPPFARRHLGEAPAPCTIWGCQNNLNHFSPHLKKMNAYHCNIKQMFICEQQIAVIIDFLFFFSNFCGFIVQLNFEDVCLINTKTQQTLKSMQRLPWKPCFEHLLWQYHPLDAMGKKKKNRAETFSTKAHCQT